MARTTTADGTDLYYEVAASGAGPTVAFVNTVGFGAWLWSWQHGAVAGPHETLVWDLRGTGRSDAPAGPYDVGTLAVDLEAVLADHGADAVHLVGAGLGGMVALEYAHRYSRADSLALFDTAASGAAVDRDALESLFAPRDDPAALRASLDCAFGIDPDAHPEVVDRIVGWRREEDADRPGWDAQIAALCSFDRSDSLYEITTPARVFHGTDDDVIPIDAGRELADGLPRGTFTAIDGGHCAFVESATAVNDALAAFLDEQTDDE